MLPRLPTLLLAISATVAFATLGLHALARYGLAQSQSASLPSLELRFAGLAFAERADWTPEPALRRGALETLPPFAPAPLAVPAPAAAPGRFGSVDRMRIVAVAEAADALRSEPVAAALPALAGERADAAPPRLAAAAAPAPMAIAAHAAGDAPHPVSSCAHCRGHAGCSRAAGGEPGSAPGAGRRGPEAKPDRVVLALLAPTPADVIALCRLSDAANCAYPRRGRARQRQPRRARPHGAPLAR